MVAERLDRLEDGDRKISVVDVAGQRRNVLHEKPSRADLADEVDERPKREVPLVVGVARASLRYALAHRPAHQDIDGADLIEDVPWI